MVQVGPGGVGGGVDGRCKQHYKHIFFRVYLGVKTSEVFLCFLVIIFPWLYCVDFSVASLYSLFYVTREFHRFLHRG